jgi:hypothetical protein
MVMVHFELLVSGYWATVRYGSDLVPPEDRVKPDELLDPTPYLMEAANGNYTEFDLSRYDGRKYKDPNAEVKGSRWWAFWGGSPEDG